MYTARLCFRNDENHTLILVQNFEKKFKTPKQAEKFLVSRVSGMQAHSLEPCISIYGQVLDNSKEYPTVSLGIALF